VRSKKGAGDDSKHAAINRTAHPSYPYGSDPPGWVKGARVSGRSRKGDVSRQTKRRAATPAGVWYIRRVEEVMPEPKLETAALIGRGFCSDVYAWGEGRALELVHCRVAPDPAAHKYGASRAIHTAGVPAPGAYA